jgi:cytochrome bd-type quinol oxidase subunit 2
MYKSRKIIKRVASFISMFFTPVLAFAGSNATVPMGWVDEIFDSLLSTPGTLEDLIVKVLNWLIGGSAVVCVVMLIVAGFTYMTSGGNEEKTQKATKTLTNAIIGLVICFVAVMLVNFVLKNFLVTNTK